MKLKTILYGIVFVLPFWIFIYSIYAQVKVTFIPSISDDVKWHEIYWGEYAGSKASYVTVFKSNHILDSKWFVEGTEYFFFVLARDFAGNNSPSSEVVSIIYGVSTNIDIPKILFFGAYPNPFVNEIKFDGYEKVEIFNIRGQLIETIITGKLNAFGYANGVYFCKGYIRKDDTEFNGFVITKMK